MMKDQVALYHHVTPQGRTIPVVVTPFPIAESAPDEEEVVWEVLRLLLNWLGGEGGTC